MSTLDPMLVAADLLDPPEHFDAEWTKASEDWDCGDAGCDGAPHGRWAWPHARAAQKAPAGQWVIWFLRGGRGGGKTIAGAEDTSRWCSRNPDGRVALVGETIADVRDTMVEGHSGLLSVLPPSALVAGSREKSWNRSLMELRLANGCNLKGFSSERPDQLRGPNHGRAWVDEPAKLRDARRGDTLDTTWNNLMLGLRIGAHPQVVCTGTPRPVKLVTELFERAHDGSDSVVMTLSTTFENLGNLAPSFQAEILDRYQGTQIARQELHGELVEEVEGALWKRDWIDSTRVLDDSALPLPWLGCCVAVDTSGSGSAAADECGIVAVAKGADRQGYVLADASLRATPDVWGRRAVLTWWDMHETQTTAATLVYERNLGGEMARVILRSAAERLLAEDLIGEMPIIGHVDARTGKRARAEPVAQRYEQKRMHHVGEFAELESQLLTWDPETDPTSPDRLDALVWAATKTVLGGGEASVFSAADVTVVGTERRR